MNEPHAASGTVCLVGGDPLVRRGLEETLAERGFELWRGEPDDLSERSDVVLVMVGLNSSFPSSVGGFPRKVLLTTDRETETFRQALLKGFVGVIPIDADLRCIVSVIRAALHGDVLLPSSVAADLAANGGGNGAGGGEISQTEADWIRALSRGMTVVELSSHAGYSEREMYRLLHRLYVRLGVKTRSEALVKAAQAGLLDP